MSAILLLSLPADAERVRNIVGALSESDLDVFWDRAEPGTAAWPEAQAHAAAARAVIFFWSAASSDRSAGPYVALAREALAAGKAICVRLDSTPLPDEIAGCTVYDLRGWRAKASSLFMLDLVAGAKAKAAGLDPPLPRAPRQLLLRRLAVAVPAGLAAIALFAGLYRDAGIDRIAGPAERAAWAALRPGSCADLRGFLAAHSEGVYAEKAQALLQARTVSTESGWEEKERPLPLYVAAADAPPAPDERGARATAARRADEEARRACEGLARAGSSQLRSAAAQVSRYQCQRLSAGTVCAADGEARCRVAEPTTADRERCGS